MTEQILNKFHNFIGSFWNNDSYPAEKMGQFVYPIDIEVLRSSSKNIYYLRESQFFWNQPKEDLFFHSLGRIDFQKVFDFNLFTFSKEIFNNLKVEITTNKDIQILNRIPFLIGNKEFSPFSDDSTWHSFFNVNWFIPKLLLLLDKSTPLLVYNFSLKSEKNSIINEFGSLLDSLFTPSPSFTAKPVIKNRKNLEFAEWEKTINKALREINKKKLDKVVISRRTEFDAGGMPGLENFLEVSQRYPECVTFFRKEEDSLFFGITPERLLSLEGNRITTEALAGSIKRSVSSSEDLLLSNELLNSGKNLKEQQYVADFIVSRLKPFTAGLKYNREPELVKLENIQHLKTAFTAELLDDKFFFDLVNELHPTPAICGIPREEAFKFITANEGYERGLYAGITGWLSLNDEADFAVSIRSALLNGNKLYAFSGCGIVEGSDPRSEYDETEIKLKPILSIFEHEN